MSQSGKPIYTIDITAENCEVNALLNGFPVYNLMAKYKTNFAKPVNSVLIEKRNSLSITLTPLVDLHNLNNIELDKKPVISGSVKIYQQGQISAPENGKKILNIDQTDLAGQYYFDNEMLSFRNTFLESPKIEDKTSLLNYAEKLLNLLKSQDAEALLHEFRPKLVEMAKAYYKDTDEVLTGFTEFMTNDFFESQPITKFLREDIFLKPWCDKRIWEISVLPNDNLFSTEPDEDDNEYTIRIFVGLVEGKLKVVR